MQRLKDKNAIVTGAGRGIGKAIAKKFLQEGAQVLICDLIEERLERSVQDLKPFGNVQGLAGNVAEADFCETLVLQAQTLFGLLHVLVNNAGTAQSKSFLAHTEQDWDQTMSVNLKSMFLMGQKAAEVMIKQGQGGVILNMASTNGHTGEHELAAYNASKAGVILLTKTMAIELGVHQIRVNSISPGFILTELAKEAGVTDERIHTYTQKIPLLRYGKPEDVANLYAFLASDEASFITGTDVIIDGGQLAQG